MSKPKFTPGPWFIDETKGPWLGGSAKATVGIWAQKRFDNAVELDDPDLGPEDEKWLCGAWGTCSTEDFANAHLIAAAPDMYKALTEVAERLRNCASNIEEEYPIWAGDLRKMADNADAALAKAEGKT